MSSLALGAIAALAWGVHDILVRFVSQRVSVSAAMFTVLLTGIVLVLAVLFIQGEGLNLLGL